jgi:hypothetical protein
VDEIHADRRAHTGKRLVARRRFRGAATPVPNSPAAPSCRGGDVVAPGRLPAAT